MAASIDNPYVVGVIASTNKIHEMWVNAIAELVNQIHDVDLENATKSQKIVEILEKVEKQYPYGMGLTYYPNDLISEEL
jgi:mannitol/fructose-specific phosphotransferase system IIA component (Ntr-type)